MNLADLQRILAPIRARLAGLVSRAAVTKTDDGPRMQEIQVAPLAREVLDGVERFQPYGLTSVPRPPTGNQSAEAVLVFAGGARDHPLAIVVDDRRYRLKALESGEVALYDDRGARVHLTRSGISIEDPDEVTVTVGAGSATVNDGEVLLAVGASSISIVDGTIVLTATSIELNSA